MSKKLSREQRKKLKAKVAAGGGEAARQKLGSAPARRPAAPPPSSRRRVAHDDDDDDRDSPVPSSDRRSKKEEKAAGHPYEGAIPAIAMRAHHHGRAGWKSIDVLVRAKPEGMSEKDHWKAETARLRFAYAELAAADVFVVCEPEWRAGRT